MPKGFALKRENKALDAVMKYEQRRGRRPRRSNQGTGYDIESSGRKIEVKTISRVKSGFVMLGERQFRTLCEDKNFWVYLVALSEHQPRIFEYSRDAILPKIRTYVHYDFLYNKQDLLRKLRHLLRQKTN